MSDSSDSDKEAIPPTSTRQPVRIDTNATVIEVFSERLFSFSELDLQNCHNCTELILRKNLIHALDPFPDHLAQRLQELDLFDNKIKKIGNFFETWTVVDPTAPVAEDGDGNAAPKVHTITQQVTAAFPNLVKLDLSYNQIKKIVGLDSLGPTLKELYLVENKIKEITGLDKLVHLELLELGGNRIRSIGNGLSQLVSLKQLWLGKNKISSLGTSLHALQALELLSVQANRLTQIEPESFPEASFPKLKEVFFSENGFTTIENLPLHAMELLDFSMNPIPSINEAVINKSNLPCLSEFWLTDGKVRDWTEVDKFKVFEDTLRTLYLERNPIEEDHRYRDKVYRALPFLTQIDSWPIVNKDNVEADRSIQRRAAPVS